MKKTQYETISDEVIEEIKTACKKRGINLDDLNLKEHDVKRPPAGNGLFHIVGQATITKDGKSKTYQTGHGSSFPAEVIVDVESGIFG